jgi:hypothetical protein
VERNRRSADGLSTTAKMDGGQQNRDDRLRITAFSDAALCPRNRATQIAGQGGISEAFLPCYRLSGPAA